MKEKRNSKIGIALIILAACFWGSMGVFVRRFGNYGFNSIQIVSIRVTIASLIFCVVLFIKDKSGFKISLKDIPLFVGLGWGSILFFYYRHALFLRTLNSVIRSWDSTDSGGCCRFKYKNKRMMKLLVKCAKAQIGA